MGKNILLLLALIVGAMTACSGSNSLSNLAMGMKSLNVGTVDFQGSSGNSNALTSSSFSHTFSNPFAQTPSVAFGKAVIIKVSGMRTLELLPQHNSVSSVFKCLKGTPQA